MAANTSVKEMITFQVGNYSNFVGAHFWNLQEGLLKDETTENSTCNELQHDILYRNGLNFHTGQRTYNPRVIAFDLKENIKNFALTDNPLADDVEDTIIWDGAVEKYDRGIKTTELNTQSPENLASSPINGRSNTTKPYNEDATSTWTDFSLSRLHDKSLQTIESLHNEMCGGFENFGTGEALFRSGKFYGDFEDRLHFFAEECDRLQGFQIFTDIHDAFAGLTSTILQDLADDYAKKGRLCFAMMPTTFKEDTRHTMDCAMLNVLLSFGKYVDAGCQVVPLSLRNSYGLRYKMVEFPCIDYKGDLDYHTSSILASAIDTTTLPYRLTDNQSTDINALVNHLSSAGRTISALCMGLPIPVSSTVTLNDLLKGPMDYIISLTPDIGRPENVLNQTTVVRGLPTHLIKPEEYQLISRRLSAMFQYKTSFGNVCPTFIAQTPCIVASPFPDVFKPAVTQVGCVIESYKRPEGVKVAKTSVMASLVNCEDVAKPLEVLLQGTDKVNIMKYPGFLEAGIEQADIESCREDVKTLVQAYQSGYQI